MDMEIEALQMKQHGLDATVQQGRSSAAIVEWATGQFEVAPTIWKLHLVTAGTLVSIRSSMQLRNLMKIMKQDCPRLEYLAVKLKLFSHHQLYLEQSHSSKLTEGETSDWPQWHQGKAQSRHT